MAIELTEMLNGLPCSESLDASQVQGPSALCYSCLNAWRQH